MDESIWRMAGQFGGMTRNEQRCRHSVKYVVSRCRVSVKEILIDEKSLIFHC